MQQRAAGIAIGPVAALPGAVYKPASSEYSSAW